jgi:uncharacterized protein (DUF983 family)
MSIVHYLMSIVQYKCPRCRKGDMYTQKYIWPLKKMLDMPEVCNNCGQKFELENGFYFGTGYVSYGLSVAFFIAYFVAYLLLFGLSIYDNSILTCLFTGIGILVLMQPWLMRISRALYLSMFVKYQKKSPKE